MRRPDDFAAAIAAADSFGGVFLASDLASCTTGSSFLVDGGVTDTTWPDRSRYWTDSAARRIRLSSSTLNGPIHPFVPWGGRLGLGRMRAVDFAEVPARRS